MSIVPFHCRMFLQLPLLSVARQRRTAVQCGILGRGEVLSDWFIFCPRLSGILPCRLPRWSIYSGYPRILLALVIP